MPAHELNRSVCAQEQTYARALDTVRAGARRSHWIRYIFPQITGLGHSPMARRYAIAELGGAEAHVADPVPGERLREITALACLPAPDAVAVFGGIDAVKLRTSPTLFAREDGEADGIVRTTFDRWFDGAEDPVTIERL